MLKVAIIPRKALTKLKDLVGMIYCLQVQRPANDWEWHILGEVSKRVNKAAPHLASSYMTVSR